MGAQELFNEAVEDYNKITAVLKELDEKLQSAVGTSYDSRITLAQYDRILQATLLTQALADGVFDPLEQQFVEKITDYGDLLTYIAKATNGDIVLTWSQVAGMPADIKAKLVALLPTLLDEVCKSFCVPFAQIDKAIDDINLAEVIVASIFAIGGKLAAIDGKTEESEAKAAAAMVSALFKKYWV